MESAIGFDLKALEVFVAIVESGGMTQSSMSRILANLEQFRCNAFPAQASIDQALFHSLPQSAQNKPYGEAHAGKGRQKH